MLAASFTPSPFGVNGFGEIRGENTSDSLRAVLTDKRSPVDLIGSIAWHHPLPHLVRLGRVEYPARKLECPLLSIPER